MFREIKYKVKMRYQKLTRGYSDEEIWNLDITICKFIAPRLKALMETTQCYPYKFKSLAQWKKELKRIICGLNIVVDDKYYNISDKDMIKVNYALKGLSENFVHLWH